MKISDNFDIREFVPPAVWTRFRERSAWMIDPRLVQVAELIRELAGQPVRINDWHMRGRFTMRGFRPSDAITGGMYSQHRRGCAIDVDAGKVPIRDLVDLCEKNLDRFHALGVYTLEDPDFTPSWLHLDLRVRIEGIHPKQGFLFVQPTKQ